MFQMDGIACAKTAELERSESSSVFWSTEIGDGDKGRRGQRGKGQGRLGMYLKKNYYYIFIDFRV